MRGLVRAVVNGAVEVRTHLLRSTITVIGVGLAVASFVLIVQMGEAGQSGVNDVIERTQGKPGTFAIDIGGELTVRRLGEWLEVARGLDSQTDLAPFFSVGDLQLLMEPSRSAARETQRPVIATLIISDDKLQGILDRPLIAGTWWTTGIRRLDLPLVISEALASELAAKSGSTISELVGADVELRGVGFSARVVGVAPASAVERYAGTEAFAVAPFESLIALPPELFSPASNARILITDPDAGHQQALTGARRINLAALFQGQPSPQVETSRVDQAAAFSGATKALAVVLAAIAGAALGVGALGIMNITLASLGARVAEFGLRRAVGATPTDIFAMVIAETSLLGLGGGLAGVAVATALSIVAGPSLASTLGIPFEPIQPTVAALGTGVSLLVGLLAGLVPAAVAKRVSILEAIRSS